MKKYILIFILIICSYFFNIPEYVELNDLAIIESIGISYKNDKFNIIFKEVIPIKEENGIKYEYKYYKAKDNSFDGAITKIKKQTKKKFYLKRVKLLVTNSINNDKYLIDLDINPTTIKYLENDVFKVIK